MRTAIWIYLLLQFFVFFGASAVILYYARNHVWNWRRWQAGHWLVTGILISFAGKLADGFYWQSAWASFLVDSETKWLQYGPVANVPLRQGFILAACACHLRGAWLVIEDTKNKLSLLFWAAIIATSLMILSLVTVFVTTATMN